MLDDPAVNAIIDPRAREREYLLAIGRALTARLELNEVLTVILRASTHLVSSKAGVVILAEPASQSFRVAAIYGVPSRVLEKHNALVQAISYQEGLEREALNEVMRCVKQMAEATDPTLTESLGLPMFDGDALIGALFVFHTNRYFITGGYARFLQSFAAQAATAVRNARLYEAVIAEKQRLNAILEQSADGVMILDPVLTITIFNAALSRMTGWPAHEAIGRSHHDIFQWHQLRSELDLPTALENGWPLPGAAPLYVEGDLQRADGSLISLGVTYAPRLTDHGSMTDIIANVRDLTRYREEQQLQKTFISVISHELKTPVSIIKGYAETLRRQDANWSPAVIDEYLATIEEEADQLNDLIDNLLEASRLQAQTFSLNLRDDIMLPELAHSVARKFSQQSDRHHITVQFPPDFPAVRGDERRLTQVLNNLMSNAIKYAPQGGPITIWGEIHPEHVTLSVRDTGIGIPEHERHRIFQKFSRLDNALSRKTEGTGLGLFLARAIVEAHQGRIWFSDNGQTPGTTFTFSLPRRSPDVDHTAI